MEQGWGLLASRHLPLLTGVLSVMALLAHWIAGVTVVYYALPVLFLGMTVIDWVAGTKIFSALWIALTVLQVFLLIWLFLL